MANRAAYITPDRPDRFWFETYSASARRFKEIAAKAGADVLISNHTIFDGSKTKLPALERRKPGDPHPYVIGTDGVQRYLTVVDEWRGQRRRRSVESLTERLRAHGVRPKCSRPILETASRTSARSRRREGRARRRRAARLACPES